MLIDRLVFSLTWVESKKFKTSSSHHDSMLMQARDLYVMHSGMPHRKHLLQKP